MKSTRTLAVGIALLMLGCGREAPLTSLESESFNRAAISGVSAQATYQSLSERLIMNAATFAYSYAPSIVRNGQRTLVWSCTMRASGGDVIRLTYSDDRINWSAPGVVLTHASKSDLPFACDPAVVFFQGYYYLFWGSADPTSGGFISLSRSPLTNPAGFANYVGGNPNLASSWKAGDSVVPARLLTPQVPCGGGGGSSCYGVGQPTVVLRNGIFHLWFTDTTGPQGTSIWHTTSVDGVSWSARTMTNVHDASVDVKFDVATNQYLMFELGSHTARPPLAVRASNDGITWSDPQSLGTAPAFSNNLGVEGTPEGNIDSATGSLFIGFGAPYGLAAVDQWGKWNLYGATLSLNNHSVVITPSASATTVNIRRLYQPATGDHLMTTDANENPTGYLFESVPFKVYTDGGAGRKAVYRCFVPSWQDHFMSQSSTCEGQNYESQYGYLASASVSGSAAIYRCFRGIKHLLTTNQSECVQNGFGVEGILGYAAP